MRPYGQQATRFLCPRNSLGKSTVVDCQFLLQGCIDGFLPNVLTIHLILVSPSKLVGPQACRQHTCMRSYVCVHVLSLAHTYTLCAMHELASVLTSPSSLHVPRVLHSVHTELLAGSCPLTSGAVSASLSLHLLSAPACDISHHQGGTLFFFLNLKFKFILFFKLIVCSAMSDFLCAHGL